MSLNLFGGTISSLEKGLTYATIKQKTIANNIANVDTPNYKAKEVSFEKIFAQEKRSTSNSYQSDSRYYDLSITQSTSAVSSNDNIQYRNNGNTVDMDAQQAMLAENQIYYNALIDRMNGKLNTLNTVIKGGR